MTRVTLQDLRSARYCRAGVRPWFARHGLDWAVFVAQGIDADDLRATGDALVEPVIRAAEDRAALAAGETLHPVTPEDEHQALSAEPVPTSEERPHGRA